MPQYKAYPTSKDTPKRMNRKRERKEIFNYNKFQAARDTRKRLAKETEEVTKDVK